VVEGRDAVISLAIEGRVLRGEAKLNGKLVERGWVLVTDDPGVGGGGRVGRIRAAPTRSSTRRSTRDLYAAVIPEDTPQALQNVLRGEGVPVKLRRISGSLHRGVDSARADIEYEAYDLTLQFSDDFLASSPGRGPLLRWTGVGRRPLPARAARGVIEETEVRFRLVEPGGHRIAIPLRARRPPLVAHRGREIGDVSMFVR
jgi:hypothetical protein